MKTFIVAVLCVMMAACSNGSDMAGENGIAQTLMCDGKATLVKPVGSIMTYDKGSYEVRDRRSWAIQGSFTPTRGVVCQLQ